MKRLAILFIFLMAIPIMAQNIDSTASREVVATGIGSIIDGDIAHARDDAIDDALRTGVEQSLGLLLESQTVVDNYQLLEDRIFSKTRGYVQRYDIVKESKRDAMLYEVTLRAVIRMADLETDLDGIATLMRRKNMPRVMVMIQERNVGETNGQYSFFEADMNTAETVIMDVMMGKGFKFVDPTTVRANLKRQQAAAMLEGDPAKAASIAKTLGAEVAVTGKAIAKATEIEVFGAKQRSQQATVNLRAIRTDTGDIIATASAQGAFPHINDVIGGTRAIEKAGKKATEEIISKILERWSADVSQGTTLSLEVKGISGFDQISSFKASLEYWVRGLTSVNQREWSGEHALFEVIMTGNSDDLAQRLSGKKGNGFVVKVTGMTQNSVSVQLQSE
ncbi:hypothetical protein KAR48_18915 [bacterium]|nr:hypothetical protein [bacterium]